MTSSISSETIVKRKIVGDNINSLMSYAKSQSNHRCSIQHKSHALSNNTQTKYPFSRKVTFGLDHVSNIIEGDSLFGNDMKFTFFFFKLLFIVFSKNCMGKILFRFLSVLKYTYYMNIVVIKERTRNIQVHVISISMRLLSTSVS